MKTSLVRFPILTSLLFGISAHAAPSISVTIDGQVYSCSAGGGWGQGRRAQVYSGISCESANRIYGIYEFDSCSSFTGVPVESGSYAFSYRIDGGPCVTKGNSNNIDKAELCRDIEF